MPKIDFVAANYIQPPSQLLYSLRYGRLE
jgi:hypothetical protein